MVKDEKILKLQIFDEINKLFDLWMDGLSELDKLGAGMASPRSVQIAGETVIIPGTLNAFALTKIAETTESTAVAEPAAGGGRKSPRTLKKNKNKRKSPRTLKKNKNKKKNTVKRRRRSVKKKH